jgi:hypothetical protein
MGALELFAFGIIGSFFGFSLSSIVKEIIVPVFGRNYLAKTVNFVMLLLLVLLFL